jgi:hypothetical protein
MKNVKEYSQGKILIKNLMGRVHLIRKQADTIFGRTTILIRILLILIKLMLTRKIKTATKIKIKINKKSKIYKMKIKTLKQKVIFLNHSKTN